MTPGRLGGHWTDKGGLVKDLGRGLPSRAWTGLLGGKSIQTTRATSDFDTLLPYAFRLWRVLSAMLLGKGT